MKNRKNEILNVVLDILSNPNSEMKLSVGNVARELNIAKSTIYEYFSKKEEMIIGALTMLFENNKRMLLSVENFESMSFEEAFKAHMMRFLELADKNEIMQTYLHHPEVGALSVANKQVIMQRMRDTLDQIEERLDEVLDKGKEEGVLRKAIPKTRKHTIQALIFGTIMAISDPFNDWDSEAVIDDVLKSLILLHQ